MNKHMMDKEKIASGISKELNIVWLRWVFLFVIMPIYIYFFKRPVSLWFILVLIAALSYNFLNYATLWQKKYPIQWFKNNIYFDIILISGLIAADGGYTSLIYIAYYIFIIYEGIKRDIHQPLFLAVGAAAAYTSIIYFQQDDGTNYLQVVFRDLFIFLSGFLVSDVVNEFMAYDRLHKKEYNLARKDKLTGLFNRNELEKVLNEEILSCIDGKSTLSVLMFDLDNFKGFNDTYGHLTGDDLLRYFAKIVLETVSSVNKAFRYGGEEFLVVLRDTELKEAYKIAEIIRKKLWSSNIYIKTEDGRQRITVSCGIACCPEHSVGYFELLEYADKALYEAKSEGKNKVVIAEKDEE